MLPDSNLIVESDFTDEGGYSAMQQLLPLEPDAVFTANDVMAIGALRALREAGKRVPDDVAVIGFDDMPFSAHSNPPLSTVRQPIHRTGMVAAETLIDMTSHPNGAPRRIVLPTELIIRASCGYGHRKSGSSQPRVTQAGTSSLTDGSTARESA